MLILTLFLNVYFSYRSNTLFIETNRDLLRLLNDLKNYLPVELLLNTIEHYESNSKELTYEMESCFVNLHGTVHFDEKEEYSAF